jgi:regulator of CtrA degradation
MARHKVYHDNPVILALSLHTMWVLTANLQEGGLRLSAIVLMMRAMSESAITPKVIDDLYQEAMRLAEQTRDYFDHVGQRERQRLAPMDRVVFSCESLKITTRLMHVISWLLVRKAVFAGEISPEAACTPERSLGRATATPMDDKARLGKLPRGTLALIKQSQALYERLLRLDAQLNQAASDTAHEAGPARALMRRLEGSL